MRQGRETVARAVGPALMKRDLDAVTWTLKNLTEDKEFVPFVEEIPAFCASQHDSFVMSKALMDEDVQLFWRIIALL